MSFEVLLNSGQDRADDGLHIDVAIDSPKSPVNINAA
jgi:hypothetical protein